MSQRADHRSIRHGALLLLLATALAPAARAEVAIPEALVPPGLQVRYTLYASGAQVYKCVEDPADGHTHWVLTGPDAVLYADVARTESVGRHFAGPNWEAADGSRIAGKMHANVPAPGADDIPWLWLDTTSTGGAGNFAGITAVQRIDTHGGKAPAGACDPGGGPLRVDYTAVYRLLAP